jgi:hypothetical protein
MSLSDLYSLVGCILANARWTHPLGIIFVLTLLGKIPEDHIEHTEMISCIGTSLTASGWLS